MGTSIEDVQYEEYLEGLHKSYVDALEELAESKSLADLRQNLENLQGAKANLPDWMTKDTDQFGDLESTLKAISTVERVYETLIEQKRENKIYFIVGLVIGSIVTILSSLFL